MAFEAASIGQPQEKMTASESAQELESHVLGLANEARANINQLTPDRAERLASTIEGQAELVKVYEAERKVGNLMRNFFGGMGAVGFGYAGLAEAMADAQQMQGGVDVGAFGITLLLATLVTSQIDLAEKIKKTVERIKQ